MKVFTGDNPSVLYLCALRSLIQEGSELAPRGKKIKELRPACFEFTNPLNRVTFLKGRKINPFFQLAESLWIMSGRSDVEWLVKYNANMKNFSDDGVYFNAPYGERLRTWNQSRANDFIFNPIDQLHDAFLKITNDPDTRQAVAVIYNPIFDNATYTLGGGKDIACNLILTFKLRNNKLDLTVFNRSNDLHWGVFGANLVQFATLQEVMASWLKVEVGTYIQITDSLHIYLDEYGAKCTDDIITQYPDLLGREDVNKLEESFSKFTFTDEPRITSDIEQYDQELQTYWSMVDSFMNKDDILMNHSFRYKDLLDLFNDDYIKLTVSAMFAYRFYKIGNYTSCITIISELPDCSWKVSMLEFVKTKIIENLGAGVFIEAVNTIKSVEVQVYLLGGRE